VRQRAFPLPFPTPLFPTALYAHFWGCRGGVIRRVAPYLDVLETTEHEKEKAPEPVF